MAARAATLGRGGVDHGVLTLGRILIYLHRWLGIAGSLIFLAWFASGVVMMYQRMPRLTAEERLARVTPVDIEAVRVPPAVAARAAGVTPERARIGMLAGRPVYRFVAQGIWTTVYADTGKPVDALTRSEALAVARDFLPEHAATMRYDAQMRQSDQWTIDGGLPRFLPMHRIAVGDTADTYLYVSDRTAGPVMKTDAPGRFWGYVGAVLHWTYFTPFRLQPGLWRWTIIYAALIGCVLCLSGLVLGIWRYSPSARFRLKRVPSHSPYAGLMWWHHYAGLVFGLFSFTWALSGALSLTPWDWVPSTAPTSQQVAAVTGGALRLEDVSIPRLRAAYNELRETIAPKELELLQFRGEPFLLAYRPPSVEQVAHAGTMAGGTFHAAALTLDHRLVLIDDPERGGFRRFDEDALIAAARAAMPGMAVEEIRRLDSYDAYYYDRHGNRPLPVLRVQYADPERTALYIDPQRGAIALKHERLTRLNRWLYNGLHSLDFPFLYDRRPWWDIVVIVLSLGGIALTVTTMPAAWYRLRRHARARQSNATTGSRARSRSSLSSEAWTERS